jgi:hypothetical protein
MALFFAKRKWRKIVSRCEMRRKMVQFWAVSWVEPVFRKIFREKGTFFRVAKCGEKCRFVVGEKWRKNGAFQKKFERKKMAKNGTFETKNRLSQTPPPPRSF